MGGKLKVVGVACACAALAAGVSWYLAAGPLKPAGQESVPAVVAPEAKKAPTKRVAIAKPVRVYDDSTKFKLRLPEAVARDSAQHVIAATQVRAELRPQTVTTVIDEATGESKSFVKEDPYPWLAAERRAEVRMSWGYRYTPATHDVRQVGRLAFTYDALRVKALTLGATVQVDTDGQAFAGVGVAYRW